MVQKLRVSLTLKVEQNVANEVAYAVMSRSNPHASELVERKLEDAGITQANLAKYFIEVGKAVADFWHNDWDPTHSTVLKPHELRSLYLPLIYGVVFSSVGNITVGNYEYLVCLSNEETIDRKFILEFSAKLESMRSYVKGEIGQVGNRSAQPQTSVMMTIMGRSSTAYNTEVNIRDGVNADPALSGLAALAGLSLVEEAYRILILE
jgi:hypothetical protein